MRLRPLGEDTVRGGTSLRGAGGRKRLHAERGPLRDRFPTMAAVQEACVTALWQAWRAHRVLGLAVSGRPLATEANANVLRVSLAAMIHPSCQSLVPKLLARTQCCPLTLETIGGSADAVSAVLSETLEGLRRALSWPYSDPASASDDAAQMAGDRALLLDIARQSQGAWREHGGSLIHKDALLKSVDVWLRASTHDHVEKRHKMTHRFILVGLLLGLQEVIVPILSKTLESGYPARFIHTIVMIPARGPQTVFYAVVG